MATFLIQKKYNIVWYYFHFISHVATSCYPHNEFVLELDNLKVPSVPAVPTWPQKPCPCLLNLHLNIAPAF